MDIGDIGVSLFYYIGDIGVSLFYYPTKRNTHNLNVAHSLRLLLASELLS